MKYFFILLTCFIYQNTMAQVPGYLGKRFTIQYNAALGSRIAISTVLGMNFNSDEHADSRYNSLKHKKNLWFDVRHDINLSYVTSKRKTFDLRYSYYKTGMAVFSYRQEIDHLFDPTERIELNQNIIGHHISVGFKSYFSGIAPIGTYLGLFSGITIQNFEYTDINEIKYKEENKLFVLIGVQYGKSFLLKKGFFLDIGSTIMWTNHSFSFDYTDSGNRGFLFNFVRVHVGVGYIF